MVLPQNLGCSLKLNTQLIATGMESERLGRTVGRADASERGDHHHAVIGKLAGLPAHARVERHTEHVARRTRAQNLLSQRQLALGAFGMRR